MPSDPIPPNSNPSSPRPFASHLLPHVLSTGPISLERGRQLLAAQLSSLQASQLWTYLTRTVGVIKSATQSEVRGSADAGRWGVDRGVGAVAAPSREAMDTREVKA